MESILNNAELEEYKQRWVSFKEKNRLNDPCLIREGKMIIEIGGNIHNFCLYWIDRRVIFLWKKKTL